MDFIRKWPKKHWKLMKKRKLKGPWFCDMHGANVSKEQASSPYYIPILKFTIECQTYFYFSESNLFYIKSNETDEFHKIEVDDWVVEELFQHTPKIKKTISSWEKFIFPIVRSSWPNLNNQIVSVQPMDEDKS